MFEARSQCHPRGHAWRWTECELGSDLEIICQPFSTYVEAAFENSARVPRQILVERRRSAWSNTGNNTGGTSEDSSGRSLGEMVPPMRSCDRVPLRASGRVSWDRK
jgi:hypothetical protein